MNNALTVAVLAVMLIIGTTAMVPTTAAPLNNRDAYAATRGQENARVAARVDCGRQARAKAFGMRFIQRRNFIGECMMERGFR
jgi:hypothetical protein